MITDAVTTVGGERLIVQGLMGPGIDPHTYKARESDSYKLEQARIIFYNGLHLEGKINSLFEHLALTKNVLSLERAFEQSDLLTTDGHADPHIWHDVKLWIQCIRYICGQLTRIDPEYADYYASRTEHYCKELEALDAYIHTRVSQLQPEQRILITAHDAFNYFARAYGMTVVGLQGVSTDAEITNRDMQELIQLIIEKKIKAIFVESALPSRPLQAVQQACAVQGWNVALGDSLYSDALGNLSDPEGTYIGMMKHNIDTIVNTLK